MALDVRLFDVYGIPVEVTRKSIHNVYVRVDRIDGRVRASVPRQLTDEKIVHSIAIHRSWIETQRARAADRPVILAPQFVTGEQLPAFGRLFTLRVLLKEGHRSSVKPTLDGALHLTIWPNSDRAARSRAIDMWLRTELQRQIPALVAKWEQLMNVSVAEWRIKRMRTRWGTCNIQARRIWLNVELARRPEECLEYVIVHEMTHLLEAGHTKHFYALMDHFMPGWQQRRNQLNNPPSRETS